MLIHPYARVVAAADAYAAMCSNRPHRNGRSPYQAMEILLKQASRDLFDRGVIRTFLDCMSLFPVGSYVKLSNGQAAKVVHANPGLHTRPVVLLLDRDGSESDIELDLGRDDTVQVVQALHHEREASLEYSS